VIPLGTTYQAVCANCGNHQRISGKDVHPLPIPSAVHCPNCQATLTDTDAFCKRCGANVTSQAAVTESPAVQPDSLPPSSESGSTAS
jgi:hypothetical protein